MKKVDYPDGIEDEYLQIFSDDELRTLQQDWDSKRSLYQNKLKPFPSGVKEILVADFEKLTEYFIAFKGISPAITTTKSIVTKNEIFNYEHYHRKIADFFIDHSSEMGITSCFYCDIHPIGKFLKTKDDRRRSFDIDHFYPQSECPILALSLKNFVPSCQVCNSRVKGKTSLFNFYKIQNLDDNEKKTTLCKISPTSKNYNFDDNVFIRVLPKIGFDTKISFLKNMNSYEIKFDSTDTYKHEIDAFYLDQRYDSVTVLSEALSLLDLKKKFPLTKMKEIQVLLNSSLNGKSYISLEEIEETIFRKNFDINRMTTLLKLKKDILE